MKWIEQAIFDTVKRKRLQVVPKICSEKIYHIFEVANIGIAVIDIEEGRFIETDQQLQRIFGYREEELRNMPISFITHTDDMESTMNLYHELIEGERDHYQMVKRYIRKDGQVIWGRLTVSIISPNLPMVIAMVEDITAQKRAEEKLKEANELLNRLSNMDGLTGIANRRRFDEYLNMEWSRGYRNQTPLSLLMIDIDFFKGYNDEYGHQAGDDCLRQISHVLKEKVKRSTDLVARYGGEEFAVILPDTDEQGAFIVAEDIRKGIEALQIPHNQSQISKVVTVSAGGATVIPDVILKPENLITFADQALYAAKQSGRNQVVFYQGYSSHPCKSDCLKNRNTDRLIINRLPYH